MADIRAKLGHAWWGVVIMAGLCLVSEVIEQQTSTRRTQLPSRAQYDARTFNACSDLHASLAVLDVVRA